jgi:drug/metabolite transporter (DMT)-like permease
MDKQNKAYIFAISAVILWSTVATAFKIALVKLDFIQLLLISSAVASIVLFVILALESKLKLAFSISKKELLQSAIRGALNPFLYYLILFKAYAILPAQEAMTLNYTWPIMLVLLSVPLLKQKLSTKGFLSVIISFFGVILIATKGDLFHFRLSNLYGDMLALSTSIIWALFWIVNLKSKIDESVKLFYSFLFGFIFTLPVAILFSDFNIEFGPSLGAAIYVGIAEMGITFFFWLHALKLSSRTDKVSQLIFLSPFLSLIFIGTILHEEIHQSTLLGLAFILGGIFINKMSSKTT